MTILKKYGHRIVAMDPKSGTNVRLFHPNNQQWTKHFQ